MIEEIKHFKRNYSDIILDHFPKNYTPKTKVVYTFRQDHGMGLDIVLYTLNELEIAGKIKYHNGLGYAKC